MSCNLVRRAGAEGAGLREGGGVATGGFERQPR